MIDVSKEATSYETQGVTWLRRPTVGSRVYIIYSTEDCVYEGIKIKAGYPVYVGSTKRVFKERITKTHTMKEFFKNYKWHHYEITIEGTKKELLDAEYLISIKLRQKYHLFNIQDGDIPTEESKLKMSKARKGKGKTNVIQNIKTRETLYLKSYQLTELKLCGTGLRRTLTNGKDHKGYILLGYE